MVLYCNVPNVAFKEVPKFYESICFKYAESFKNAHIINNNVL